MRTTLTGISTPRLLLRRWKESDAAVFVAMNGDPEVMKFYPRGYSERESREMIERIESSFNKLGFGLFAVENRSTREFIGYTGFSVPAFSSWFTPCVEIGWRYRKEAWGNGYATEAARACLEHGFGELGFDKVFSFTSPLNVNSEKVMQRIGMLKFGEFDHPRIEAADRLCRHVLYRVDGDGPARR
jgi:RimJ/RimL family protein N-acetyltransferase